MSQRIQTYEKFKHLVRFEPKCAKYGPGWIRSLPRVNDTISWTPRHIQSLQRYLCKYNCFISRVLKHLKNCLKTLWAQNPNCYTSSYDLLQVRNVFQSEFEPQSLRYSQWTLSWIVPPKITRYLQNPQTTWSNWKVTIFSKICPICRNTIFAKGHSWFSLYDYKCILWFRSRKISNIFLQKSKTSKIF